MVDTVHTGMYCLAIVTIKAKSLVKVSMIYSVHLSLYLPLIFITVHTNVINIIIVTVLLTIITIHIFTHQMFSYVRLRT